MRKFYQTVEGEVITEHQNIYDTIIELEEDIDFIRRDMISFCVGSLDNEHMISRIPLENRGKVVADFINNLLIKETEIETIMDSAKFYLIEQYRKTGSRMNIHNPVKKNSYLNAEVEYVDKKHVEQYVSDCKENFEERIEDAKQKIIDLNNLWVGDNYDSFNEQIIKSVDSILNEYNNYAKLIVEEKEELEK